MNSRPSTAESTKHTPQMLAATKRDWYYTKYCAVCGRHSREWQQGRLVNRRTITPRFCGSICAKTFIDKAEGRQ